jgi:hypothetical protein
VSGAGLVDPGSGGLSSMKANHVSWKPLRPSSSEIGDAAICYEASRAAKPGVASAQDLEQLFDGFSLFEAASLILTQQILDLGAL